MSKKEPKKERKVWLIDGRFHPCPEKRVCVSTQASEDDIIHYIEPIKVLGTIDDAKQRILQIVNSLKGTKILEKDGNYIHVLFTTKLFKFKDDVEFYFDEEQNVIHFRSQSRIGGYDWNANRKRMENIRVLYQNK